MNQILGKCYYNVHLAPVTKDTFLSLIGINWDLLNLKYGALNTENPVHSPSCDCGISAVYAKVLYVCRYRWAFVQHSIKQS